MRNLLMSFTSTIDSLLLNKTNFIEPVATTKSQLFGHTTILYQHFGCYSMLS